MTSISSTMILNHCKNLHHRDLSPRRLARTVEVVLEEDEAGEEEGEATKKQQHVHQHIPT